jgi:hypothetical protein
MPCVDLSIRHLSSDVIAVQSRHRDAPACIDCDAGKYNPTTASTAAEACIDCNARQYADTTGNTECIECDAGKYNTAAASAEASACIDCDADTYNTAPASTEASARIGCDTGKYNQRAGTSKAASKDCGAGKYADAKGSADCIFLSEVPSLRGLRDPRLDHKTSDPTAHFQHCK